MLTELSERLTDRLAERLAERLLGDPLGVLEKLSAELTEKLSLKELAMLSETLDQDFADPHDIAHRAG